MPPLASGQIANVDIYGRLALPVDVLREISWWRGDTVRVVVEAYDVGHLRIFEASAIADELDRLSAGVDGEAGLDGIARLAVLADRYRPGVIYKEKRLPFVRETAAIVDVVLGSKAELFVQPVIQWIEVLTLERRLHRLKNHSAFPPLDVESILPLS
jgi:hypothetical protein